MANENKPQAPAIVGLSASGTVYVGCKIPNGIRFDDLPSGRAVKLNGHYTPISKDAFVISPDGAGITAVPAEDWNEVMQVWKDHAAIKNGLIFAVQNDERAVKAEAINRKAVKTGMEQVEQNDKVTA